MKNLYYRLNNLKVVLKETSKIFPASKIVSGGEYHFVLRTPNMPTPLSLRRRALDEKALDLLTPFVFPFIVNCLTVDRPPQFPYLVYWGREGWVF